MSFDINSTSIINNIMKRNEFDLMAEQYTKVLTGKVLNESYEQEEAPPHMGAEGDVHPAEDESLGEFDEFVKKAEVFVDNLGDAGLVFLMNLGKHQFETFMQIVKDEHGYRDENMI
jgi:hypothetical protein